MRTAIIGFATLGILVGMWLDVGVRILSKTHVVMGAVAEACARSEGGILGDPRPRLAD